MVTPTDLKSLYEAATQRKLKFWKSYFGYISVAFVCVSIFALYMFKADLLTARETIIASVIMFVSYVIGSSAVGIMVFFNDTFFDISESVKK